jgi:hypothetical protein
MSFHANPEKFLGGCLGITPFQHEFHGNKKYEETIYSRHSNVFLKIL